MKAMHDKEIEAKNNSSSQMRRTTTGISVELT
ncbi:hypothetical protein LINGRAHAP2_LOCUS11390 [Linum grandiflorum]